MTAFANWLGIGPDDTHWADRGLCREVDAELFYPEKGGSAADAKQVCGMCDVRDECLEFALAGLERFGIWGGFSARERRQMLRDRGIELDLGGVA